MSCSVCRKISEPMKYAGTRRIPPPMSRPWQGMQRRRGVFHRFPKGEPYKVCGCVASFGKDRAIAGRTRLATHLVQLAEIMRHTEQDT